ncbi:hypothetical protein GCM10009836_38740 [Pseudonocardia ailaonensis]|uniref:Uncharacterized protein n=1 Tax=Pseudonocardia ailaonensis TaxID=367279 RepID=A0ABN2N7S2_9PSEU
MTSSLLMVELPVPAGREEEWNTWYHEVHMPDVLANVPGVVATRRYRVLNDADHDIHYVVLHEFASLELLEAYIGSTTVADRWGEYEVLWGRPAHYRRRGLQFLLELP